MSILKPALCAAALTVAAALAIPAIAQQPRQDNEAPSAGPPPDAGRTPDDRAGPDWQGNPRGRYSDEDRPGPGWRRWYHEGQRYGQGDDGGRYDRRWRERRFGGEMRDRGMMGDHGMMGGHGMMGNRGMMGDRGGMMRPFGMARFCGPEGARTGEAMIFRIERATQPTAEQRPAFDKLKEAAGKAGEIIRGACPAERSLTPTGRLAAAEKRLSAMLDAVRTLRPAMDAFYGSLSDEQKARLTLMQPRMRGPGMGIGPRGHDRPDNGRDQEQREDPYERGDRTHYAPDKNSQTGAEKL